MTTFSGRMQCVCGGGWVACPGYCGSATCAPSHQHQHRCKNASCSWVTPTSVLSSVSWLGIIAHKRIISGQDFTQCSVCMFCYTPGVCADTLECSRTWRRSSAINIDVVEMLRMKDGRMLIIYNTFLSITLSSKCMSLPLSLSVKVEIKTRIK